MLDPYASGIHVNIVNLPASLAYRAYKGPIEESHLPSMDSQVRGRFCWQEAAAGPFKPLGSSERLQRHG